MFPCPHLYGKINGPVINHPACKSEIATMYTDVHVSMFPLSLAYVSM